MNPLHWKSVIAMGDVLHALSKRLGAVASAVAFAVFRFGKAVLASLKAHGPKLLDPKVGTLAPSGRTSGSALKTSGEP